MAEGEDSSLTFDWSLNGALLFGQQKVRVEHQSSIFYHPSSQNVGYGTAYFVTAYPGRRAQTRSVTIPNVGGSVGLSFRYTNAKLSLGYRADFFFGAADTGIDGRRTTTLGFNGPFASVSIGLGG